MKKCPKIACYGFIEKGKGSLSGAHFLVLEEMLKRGYEVDCYGWPDFNEPYDLKKYSNYRFIPLPSHSIDFRNWKFLPSFLSNRLSSVFNLFWVLPQNGLSLRKSVIYQHITRKYDYFIVMGLASPFKKIPNLKTISWLQGHPTTEWVYLHKLRKIISDLCGQSLYWKLKFFYLLKNTRYRREIQESDILICGSQWSKDHLIESGIPDSNVAVIPYPIDLNFFSSLSDEVLPCQEKTTFLWLGRIDPRKRLDLLIEAYEGVVEELSFEIPDLKLRVIGRIPYAQGYQSLIDNFKYPDYLEYRTNIDREDIPSLLRYTGCLVQPSEGENFGTSVSEALASGVPVILGPSNGTQEFTGSSAFKFSEYTSDALKETMVSAIREIRRNQKSIVRECIMTAEKNFDVKKVVDDIEGISAMSPQSNNQSFISVLNV